MIFRHRKERQTLYIQELEKPKRKRYKYVEPYYVVKCNNGYLALQAKSKTEAYEIFKNWISEKNESYGRMWFPGTEGTPHLKALPMSEGRITFRPKKGEIYC